MFLQQLVATHIFHTAFHHAIQLLLADNCLQSDIKTRATDALYGIPLPWIIYSSSSMDCYSLQPCWTAMFARAAVAAVLQCSIVEYLLFYH
jgi:hypothetical protein